QKDKTMVQVLDPKILSFTTQNGCISDIHHFLSDFQLRKLNPP
ncbi:22377_t:CDS:1, partial [Gigaspora rosea]